MAVNERWRRFAAENGATGNGCDPGQNYLTVCDRAVGEQSDEAAAVATGIRAVLNGDRTAFSFDYPCHGPTERRWYKLLAGRTVDRSGSLILHIDITPEKLAQLEVEHRRAEAERAVAARDRFLAAASHDLRQPLQAAELFISMLRTNVPEGRPSDLVGHLSNAMGALRDILDSLTDISRLETGQQQVAVERFRLGDIIDQVAAEAEAMARDKGLELRKVPCSVEVTTDPQLLGRILRNLLCNAVRYTNTGRVLIGVRRRAGGTMEVIVQDTGIGIDPEQQKEVFAEFYQVGNPERDRRKGLGLGLSIVKRLSDLLGFNVLLCSRQGHGTAVSVRIPPSRG